MGGVICGLVQPSAPPQRDQIRDAPPAPQRRCCGDLPSPGCRLRTGAPDASTKVVTIHTLLASAGGGLDQSPNTGKRTPTSYVCHGCLNTAVASSFLAVTAAETSTFLAATGGVPRALAILLREQGWCRRSRACCSCCGSTERSNRLSGNERAISRRYGDLSPPGREGS